MATVARHRQLVRRPTGSPVRRTGVAVALLLAVLLGSATPAPAEVPAALRIMAVGDSITEAKWKTPGRDSYRSALWYQLRDAGYTGLDFVGSKVGVKDNPNPPGDWDKDHEGHYGWRADQIVNGNANEPAAGRMADWAATYRPDIALVHIGSNDMNQGQSVASTLDDIRAIVAALRAGNPSVKIAVAQVIPWTKTAATDRATRALNAAMPALAEMSTASSPVVVVDQNTGYDPACNYDKVHPKPCGQRTIADRWVRAMESNGWLPGAGPGPAPEPINTAPVVSAGADQVVAAPGLSARLDGTASDDGRPSGQLTSTWTQAAGPATATIEDPASLATGVQVPAPGWYEFRLSASDGSLSAADDVAIRFADATTPSSGRTTNGLVALYEFEEMQGSVARDTSGFGEPLDLTLQNPAAAVWSPGVLTLRSRTALASAGPATKITAAVSRTNEITVEAWVDPASLDQPGPARIVTVSTSTSLRNVTLGQESTYVAGRLRTTETGGNGTPATLTPAGSFENRLVHVVYTRSADGAATIYLDGVASGSATIGGSLADSWNAAYPLLLGTEVGGNRPWLGEYHLVALFDRALSPAEVLANYEAGAGS